MIMRLKLVALWISCWMFLLGTATLPAQNIQEAFGEGTQSLTTNPLTTNKVLWQQYQALQAGLSPSGCQSCGPADGSPQDRCGCNSELFSWNDGPGNCDQWCVGPKWEVQANGLMLFREDADLGRV
ncbi:MAG: hypothetical protein GXP28_11035, partial [Planctomycetes bacterium]|nr:hypothetical protein [Planctomycetota bacterium]